MTAPTSASPPLKRRWGLSITFCALGLGAVGLGIGDLFQHKTGPGALVIGIGVGLCALGIFAFSRQYTPDKPLPPLGISRYIAMILAGALAGLAFPILFPVFGHQEQLSSGITEIL